MKTPQITEAKIIAERIGAEAVVILAFNGDRVAGTSYGATKAKCKTVGVWMEDVIHMMERSEMLPPLFD